MLRNCLIALIALIFLMSSLVSEGQDYTFTRLWPGEILGLRQPTGVAVSSSGIVYVVDYSLNQVIKYDASGFLLGKWGTQGYGDGQFNVPRGIAVDSQGNVYVADTNNYRIQKFTANGVFLAKWGTFGSGDGQFSDPCAIAIDSQGNVYVVDINNCRIQKFTANGVFLAKWGTQGSGDGQFIWPEGIAVDSQGNVYVTDTSNCRIQKFTANGVFLAKWGNYGWGDGQFRYLVGITVDSQGNVYVADTNNYRIQKFTANGVFLVKWGTFGSGDGQFLTPRGIAVDNQGNVYVADIYNSCIQKFTANGVFLAKWGTEGSGDGQLNSPYGIAIDSQGNVYVADTQNYRIQKFTSNGVFLAKWGTFGSGDGQFNWPRGIAVDSQGNVYVTDSGNNRIQKFTSNGVFLAKWGTLGSGDAQFNYPYGIAADNQGNVYVADINNHRIQKFTSNGAFLMKWGTQGSGNGQFSWPNGIAVDSQGNVYMADSGNNRIQKFISNGVFLAKWGTWGTGDGQFNWPRGIAVDSQGNVYVADSNNHRIQVFSPTFTLSPASLDFGTAGTFGGFYIENKGSGTLTWSASKSQPWLTISSASGSLSAREKTIVWVTVNRTGLACGTYTDTISITSNGGNGSVSVSMTVPGDPPLLSLSLTSLDFGTAGIYGGFIIENKGCGTLTWSASRSQPWLTVSPASGSVPAGGKTTVSVTVNRTGLACGTYTDTISITSNGGNGTVSVSMTVAVNPQLSLSLTSLDFGTAVTSGGFIIENKGCGTLTWQVPGCPIWLTVSPTSGSLSAGEKTTVSVTVNRTGLACGTYTGTISIQASQFQFLDLNNNGIFDPGEPFFLVSIGGGSVSVSMTVPGGPQLSLSLTSLDFGTVATFGGFYIENKGCGTLTGSGSISQQWLTVSPASGSLSAGDKMAVWVTVNRTGLACGTYTDTISIISNGGNGSVSVSMTVPGDPQLSLSLTSLDFGTVATFGGFYIENKGCGTLTWSASKSQPWLTISSASGSLSAGEKTIVWVTVNRTDIACGPHTDTISVTSNGGNGSVSVSMTVTDNPQLSLSLKLLDFGAAGTFGGFYIENKGCGTLTWSATKSQPWLIISSASGSLSGGEKTVVWVTVNRTGLSSGPYTDTISITSNGGNGSVLVSMTVPVGLVSMLGQCYPNPFNPETWIPYVLSKECDVTIRIYNVQGQVVRTLSLGRKEAGSYIQQEKAAYWDGLSDAGESVASGVYFYHITAGSFSQVKRMVVKR